MSNYDDFRGPLREICERANRHNDNNDDKKEDNDHEYHFAEDDHADANGSSSIASTTKTTMSKKTKSSLTPFRNANILDLRERHRYGFALCKALRKRVQTPYL